MFSLRLFGRKALPASPVADASPFGTALAHAIRRGEGNPYGQTRVMGEYVAQLSPAERAELLADVASEADAMRDYPRHNDPDPRPRLREAAVRACFFAPIEPAPEHLRPLATLLCNANQFAGDYFAKDAIKVVRLLDLAVAKGAHLDAADAAMLDNFAASRRILAEKKERQRETKRACLALAEAIEELTGSTRSATTILLDRCEPADGPRPFAPLPDDIDFWSALMAETAAALAEIAADLRAKTKPAWLKKADAFASRFPPVGPLSPGFGMWNADALASEHHDGRNFANLRDLLKRKRALASPETFRSVREEHARLSPLALHDWSGTAIPAVERLGDLADADTTALLEQLVVTKDGPRPPARWLKATLAIAERIGPDAVQARVLDWLALFHTPCASDAALAASWSTEVIGDAARHLATTFPDWPARVPADQLPAFGAALAIELAAGDRIGFGSYQSLFFLSERGTGALDAHGLRGDAGQGVHRRYAGHLYTTLTLSLENEQFVRALVWLLPHLPDRAASIDALERCVLAGVATANAAHDGRRRARAVSTAAVAALQAMDDPDALLALHRLSRTVEDGATLNAIRAALTA